MNISLAFLNQIILARNFSVENFGIFSSYMGFINILTPLVSIGITSYWLKVFGKTKKISKELILSSLVIISISFILTFTFVLLTIKFHGFDNLLLFSILSTIILASIFVEMIATLFQVKGDFLSFSLVQSGPTFFKFIFLIILVFILENISLVNVSLIWASATILIPFLFYKIVLKEFPNPLFNFKKIFSQIKNNSTYNIFKNSLIFGLVGLLYLGWSQGHIIFAKLIFGNYGAGLYSSVIILCIAISIFPNVIFSKFLAPKYHKLIYSNPNLIKDSFWSNNIMLFIFGILITLFVYLLSDFLIDLLFGKKYQDASIILKILAITFPMRFCGFNSGLILTTHDFLSIKFKILLMIVLLNLTLAYIFSELIGLSGLALSIVISELILVLIYIYKTKFLLNKLCIQTKNML